MRMKTIIAALAAAILALPLAAQASPPATRPVPLPLAAQAAVNKARQARAKALAAYRLAVRAADRAEFLALKVAERQTMRTGTLQQAEAVHAEIRRVQKRFAVACTRPIDQKIDTGAGWWSVIGYQIHNDRAGNCVNFGPDKKPILRGWWRSIGGNKFIDVWNPSPDFPNGHAELITRVKGEWRDQACTVRANYGVARITR